jgi:hypothetical protein
MPGILTILSRTPWWAYALLIVLIIFGVQALRDRSLPIWRLLIIPAVFIGWGLLSLAQRGATPGPIAVWAICAAVGVALGFATARNQFQITPGGAVAIKGSIVPLIRNLVIFAVKYVLTAAVMIRPALRDTLAPYDIAVSGLAAGYFLGWLIRLAQAFSARSRQSTA